jgi:predicted small lipoprotein YifL
MKNRFKILTVIALSVSIVACNNKKPGDETTDSTVTSSTEMSSTSTAKVVPGSYTDLNTGKSIYIIADPETGWAVDSISKVPVEFYVDRAGDTLFQSGVVVNNAIMKTDGKWMLDETKIKRDGDEIKIKCADGDKIKMDDDEMKMKTQEGKIKVDDDTTKIKPKN